MAWLPFQKLQALLADLNKKSPVLFLVELAAVSFAYTPGWE